MPQIRLIVFAAVLAFAVPSGAAAGPERLPSQVGRCAATTITSIGTRLIDGGEPAEGSGSEVRFTNGGRQVSMTP